MNGIIIIDKPSGWTSHDVVGKLRGVLKEKRIGHGGTLDPMATGGLPVFVGRATRAVQFCENAEKEYTAGFLPGTVTDTQDVTGNVLEKHDTVVTLAELNAVLPRFVGEQEQIPPMYSAVKIGGKKLYELARKGVEVERKPRRITISALSAYEEGGVLYLDVTCSKGTYIRTLCHDIGAALGCGGCMSSLRRTRAGAFDRADAVSLEYVIEAVSAGRAEDLLRPVDTLFSGRPEMRISESDEKKCRCGGDFKTGAPDGEYRVYSDSGEFLMLGKARDGRMYTIKSFFEV